MKGKDTGLKKGLMHEAVLYTLGADYWVYFDKLDLSINKIAKF